MLKKLLSFFRRDHIDISSLAGKGTLHATQPLRLALQVASLDKGGLEQVVFNLVRSLHGKSFLVTLIICGDEPGYLGSQLVLEGYDVVSVGWNKERLKDILTGRRIEIANLHYTVFGMEVYSALHIPVVYTTHNSYTWLSRSEVRARKRAYRQVAAFIAVSSQVQTYFHRRFFVPLDSIKVIPNGIDVSDLVVNSPVARSGYGFEVDDFIFVNVSTFVPTKFQGLMISALKHVVETNPNARLLLIGNVMDPEYLAFILNRIREERLEQQVRIVDFIPRTELGKLLSIADCFLLPSLQEGWSNAIMEAMYFNLPLILSDTGSARDIVTNNDIGIIIPNPYVKIERLDSTSINKIAYDKSPANLEHLILAMTDMIENAVKWRKECSGSKDLVIADLTVANMATAYGQLLSGVQQLIARRDD